MEDTEKKKKSCFSHAQYVKQQDDMEVLLKINAMIHIQSIFLDFEITKTDENTM